MEETRFELFSNTVYTLIPLLKKHFLPVAEGDELRSLTGSHFHLLFTLHFSGPLTMTEAARKAGFSKPHATLLADKLVEEGLIERFFDPDDRRVVSIRLTDKGNLLLVRQKEIMKEKAWKLFSALTEETVERTLDALLTLKEIMVNAQFKTVECDVGKTPLIVGERKRKGVNRKASPRSAKRDRS
jgi:DNA-binding MarR family transcriptional regulator